MHILCFHFQLAPLHIGCISLQGLISTGSVLDAARTIEQMIQNPVAGFMPCTKALLQLVKKGDGRD